MRRKAHRAVMYKEFKKLWHRVQDPDHGDLTMWPLEKFVANQMSLCKKPLPPAGDG
ncbi:hypothetical protein CEP54_002831 [Fusarium duplospermum]|uniref:Uncharacterized protein n=1 Tax=Fusarium duplospermum TaxID=1325734 RepID=A0A428QT40_9HYPO|nr:hypothetical protein CEP54_002831 [Fusarium duplospermum]